MAEVVVDLEGFVGVAIAGRGGLDHRGKFDGEGLVAAGDGRHPAHVVPQGEDADFLQGFFLGFEIVVEAALADAQLVGDVPGGGGVVALVGKDPGRSGDSAYALVAVASTYGG